MKGLKMVIGLMVLGALAGGATTSHAGSDYTLARPQDETFVGDSVSGRKNPVTWRVSVPANVLRSTEAILMFEVRDSGRLHNEIYINPIRLDGGRLDECGDASPTPSRNPDPIKGSIGKVQFHPGGDNREYYTQQVTFSGWRLNPGQENTVMMCARTAEGFGRGDVDDFAVRNMVLHYRIQ
jgi:hypothetical protein